MNHDEIRRLMDDKFQETHALLTHLRRKDAPGDAGNDPITLLSKVILHPEIVNKIKLETYSDLLVVVSEMICQRLGEATDEEKAQIHAEVHGPLKGRLRLVGNPGK